MDSETLESAPAEPSPAEPSPVEPRSAEPCLAEPAPAQRPRLPTAPPRESLDTHRQQLREFLRRLEATLARERAGLSRLRRRADDLRQRLDRIEAAGHQRSQEARALLAEGRDDLARHALAQRSMLRRQRERMQKRLASEVEHADRLRLLVVDHDRRLSDLLERVARHGALGRPTPAASAGESAEARA